MRNMLRTRFLWLFFFLAVVLLFFFSCYKLKGTNALTHTSGPAKNDPNSRMFWETLPYHFILSASF